MGLFHCVQAGCAEVRYKPYRKSGGIRYRYPGENWITVNGDNYSLAQESAQCTDPNIKYSVDFTIDEINAKGQVVLSRSTAIYGLPGYRVVNSSNPTYFKYLYPTGAARYGFIYVDFADSNGNVVNRRTRYNTDNAGFAPESFELLKIQKYQKRGTRFYPVEQGTSPCDRGKCSLTIFLDEEIVFQRISNECPEVERLENENSGCRLSDRTRVIKIKKSPFLRRIEVTPYDYFNFGANVYRANIPDNCLVVRSNHTATLPPNIFGPLALSNSAIDADYTYGFVQQICSDEGCPPPEYEVICNCEGDECPPGTCPVECGAVVCCYDRTTGRAVDQIPLENYRKGDIS